MDDVLAEITFAPDNYRLLQTCRLSRRPSAGQLTCERPVKHARQVFLRPDVPIDSKLLTLSPETHNEFLIMDASTISSQVFYPKRHFQNLPAENLRIWHWFTFVHPKKLTTN